MATQNSYTTAPDSNYPRRFPFTFPSLDSSEVYVTVAGNDKTIGATNDYTLNNYTKASGGYIEFVSDTTRGTGTVRIFRQTSGSLKHTFQAGSSIKAEDLNTANKQPIYLAEEIRSDLTGLTLQSLSGEESLTIDGSNIADNSITTNKIQDLEVKSTDLSSHASDDTKRAVTSNHIRDNAVTSAKLSTSVETAINANTAKVTNANHTGDVTGNQALTISDNAVTSAKIANGTIVNDDINASAGIAFSKLATGTIPSDIKVDTGNILNTATMIASLLPNQSGNSGKSLTTNGSTLSWGSGVKIRQIKYDSDGAEYNFGLNSTLDATSGWTHHSTINIPFTGTGAKAATTYVLLMASFEMKNEDNSSVTGGYVPEARIARINSTETGGFMAVEAQGKLPYYNYAGHTVFGIDVSTSTSDREYIIQARTVGSTASNHETQLRRAMLVAIEFTPDS